MPSRHLAARFDSVLDRRGPRGFWTADRRAELLRFVELGNSIQVASEHFGCSTNIIRIQLWHARRAVKAVPA